MPGWMAGWPVGLVLVAFFTGALLRSQGLYWAGRGLTAGLLRAEPRDGAGASGHRSRLARVRTALARRLDSDQVTRARSAIERWGMPVIPLAFLTVGFQSAVFAAAGLVRVGWPRFTLWALPGAAVWAVVWGGGGMAAAAGVVAAARRSPWALAAVLAAVGLVVVAVAALRRHRQERTPPAGDGAVAPGRPPAAGRPSRSPGR